MSKKESDQLRQKRLKGHRWDENGELAIVYNKDEASVTRELFLWSGKYGVGTERDRQARNGFRHSFQEFCYSGEQRNGAVAQRRVFFVFNTFF